MYVALRRVPSPIRNVPSLSHAARGERASSFHVTTLTGVRRASQDANEWTLRLRTANSPTRNVLAHVAVALHKCSRPRKEHSPFTWLPRPRRTADWVFRSGYHLWLPARRGLLPLACHVLARMMEVCESLVTGLRWSCCRHVRLVGSISLP